MDAIKLCNDCKWVRKNPKPQLSKCAHPKGDDGRRFVDGEINESWASVNRNQPSLCGEDAKWFEPRAAQDAA